MKEQPKLVKKPVLLKAPPRPDTKPTLPPSDSRREESKAAPAVSVAVSPVAAPPGKESVQPEKRKEKQASPLNPEAKVKKKRKPKPVVEAPPPEPVTFIGKQRRRTLAKLFAQWFATGRRWPAELAAQVAAECNCEIKLLEQTLKEIGLRKINRATGFTIEKLYLDLASAWTRTLPDLVFEISRRTRIRKSVITARIFDLGQMQKEVFDAPEPTAEQKEEILAQYQTYLQGDTPPPLPLHRWIATQLNDRVTPVQVHQTLARFRFLLFKKIRGQAAKKPHIQAADAESTPA